MNRPIALLACLALFVAAPIGTAQPSFRVLITNDDGIDSPGIAALVEAISEIADVTVVAPSTNRSGSSHSTDIGAGRPTRVTLHRRNGSVFGYAVDATPADAVRFGVLRLGGEQPFDLVISGINDGANVGSISHLSGTVGAAMEALRNSVPAIAVSQSRERRDFTVAAEYAAKLVAQVRDRGLPPGVMLSVNVPAGEIRGAVAARMAESEFRVSYTEAGKDEEATLYRIELSRVQPRDGGDTQAFVAGYVTVTPLRFDWTDDDMLGALGDWDLSR